MKKIKLVIICIVLVSLVIAGVYIYDYFGQVRTLEKVVKRLQADTRVAEVLVTDVRVNQSSNKRLTTIKFLEYDTRGNSLEPKYFTFSGDIIQFQSLVIRFDDIHIRKSDSVRGKSVYLFWKVFLLDGKNTEEYIITPLYSVPEGYKIKNIDKGFQKRLWQRFWGYALNNKESESVGVKNAQIEAPGTKFVPGLVYTIKIEHDGGLRIDTKPVPQVLKGEFILN